MLNFRVPRESRQRESRVERDVIIGLDLAAAAGVDKACAISRQGTVLLVLFFISIVIVYFNISVMLMATFCIMDRVCLSFFYFFPSTISASEVLRTPCSPS